MAGDDSSIQEFFTMTQLRLRRGSHAHPPLAYGHIPVSEAFFPRPRDLKHSGEEFRCAQAIDSHSQVQKCGCATWTDRPGHSLCPHLQNIFSKVHSPYTPAAVVVNGAFVL